MLLLLITYFHFSDCEQVAVTSVRIPLMVNDTILTSNLVQGPNAQLFYMGGIEIQSDSPLIGGVSSILVSDDGKHLLCALDSGYLMTADLVYDNRQKLYGVKSPVEVFRLPAQWQSNQTEFDVEGLTTDSGIPYGGGAVQDVYISIEGAAPNILHYKDGVLSKAGMPVIKNQTALSELRLCPVNASLERLVVRQYRS